MDQKSVAPQEEPNLTAEPREASEQDLDQVAGGVSDHQETEVLSNPLYEPSGNSGMNPLYKA